MLETNLKNTNSKDKRELYPHQAEAIENWFSEGKRGILEMATGTGKTFTALKCMERLMDEVEDLVVIISCPYSHLIEQWEEDIGNMFSLKPNILCNSLNYKWKKELMNVSFNLEMGVDNNAIILTTHNSFSNQKFIDEMRVIDNPILLIVDEMHHVGAKGFRKGLLDKYEYRLGLSATPSRYMDDVGTDFLFDYFNKTVFEFSIGDALINKNKDGKSFLTPYDYFPERVNFTSDELDKYIEITRKINMLFHIEKKSKEENESLEHLYRLRQAIVNNAEYKYKLLEEILDRYEDIDHLIIFCSDKQIDNVLKILNEKNVGLVHRFTSKEKNRKSEQFEGLSEREYLLKKFDEGEYVALVAMKCLDEGVDVPSADKVIIMSSTTNPREYIQRRGRVLRRYEGKDKARIYDMVVVLDKNDDVGSLKDNEKRRMMDFIKMANNDDYGIKLLKKWGMFYDV